MNPEVFGEWLQRQGQRVIKTASSYWHEQAPRIYQAFPYEWCIQPSRQEIQDLLIKENAIGVRYSAPLHVGLGQISYHTVFDMRPFSLELLSANTRSTVRRGLKSCQIEQISLTRLADEGWELQSDTLERQNRVGSLDQAKWQNICLSAEGLPGFEAWAAIVEGKLAASILVATIFDVCYMLYPQSHRQYFKLHVNNALSFAVSTELMARPHIRSIFYGLHSLDADSSVDEFKLRMGYSVKPVQQRVAFHPLLSPLFNSFSHRTVKLIQNRYAHNNPTVAKVEGMLRFYLDGQKPLTQQQWPDCLLPHKMDILNNKQT